MRIVSSQCDKMRSTFPPRRTLLPYTRGCERRRGKVYERLTHKNSDTPLKTQIWCALATYVLIAIIKKELQIDASLYTLLQILSISVFEKTQLQRAFAGM